LDATLREITGLVKEINPDARSKRTYFDFLLVTPESLIKQFWLWHG